MSRRFDCISQGVWTDKAVARLRALWAEGRSCSQIANALGAEQLGMFTRNAVIGKVNRLGLGKRASPARPQSRERLRARARSYAEPRPPRAIAAAAPAPIEELEPLLDDTGAPRARNAESLVRGQCRWPIGDPLKASFAFCARPANTDGERDPYCECHRQLARQRGTSMQSRRRRA